MQYDRHCYRIWAKNATEMQIISLVYTISSFLFCEQKAQSLILGLAWSKLRFEMELTHIPSEKRSNAVQLVKTKQQNPSISYLLLTSQQGQIAARQTGSQQTGALLLVCMI